jgi:hypothetical protein
MAYGPSVIGFSLDPLSLVLVVVIIAAIAIGGFLYSRKKDGKQ